jgi:hypothetical protein
LPQIKNKSNKMKRILTLSFIALAAITGYKCSSGSAENENGKLIVKKWQWESMSSKAFDDQVATLRTQADTTKDSTMKAMLDQQVKGMDAMMEAIKSTTMEFKADGTSETSMAMMGQSETKKGKWTLTTDGKKLLSTDTKADGGEKTDTIAIKELTADKLVLTGPDGKGGEVTITMKPAK